MSPQALTRTPVPSRAHANAALAAARRTRARWLLAVTAGQVTPTEVIAQAATASGRPLLALTLRQLVIAQPGWGVRRTEAALAKLASFSQATTTRRMNISWLLDPRCAGSRYIAWCDVMHTRRDQAPWPGFPFTAGPAITAHPTVASLMGATTTSTSDADQINADQISTHQQGTN